MEKLTFNVFGEFITKEISPERELTSPDQPEKTYLPPTIANGHDVGTKSAA
jgi:hypothetical protein